MDVIIEGRFILFYEYHPSPTKTDSRFSYPVSIIGVSGSDILHSSLPGHRTHENGGKGIRCCRVLPAAAFTELQRRMKDSQSCLWISPALISPLGMICANHIHWN